MNKGCRLRAKGKEIVFDTADGKKKFTLKPLRNEQLLKVTELGEQEKGMESALLMAKCSLNNGLQKEEEHFDDEEIKQMEACFLMPILKEAAELNGLGDMFDFQKRAGVPDQNLPFQRKSKVGISQDIATLKAKAQVKV